MVKVRDATLADIPEMIRLGRAMHAESPRYSALAFSSDKIEALLNSMLKCTLTTDPVGGAFVAVKAEKIIGILLGYVGTTFFSDDKVASDYVFFIVPEQRRKGRAAVALVNAFEAWAAAQGAVQIAPGVSSMIDAESSARFYGRLGYEQSGYLFLKRIA